MTWLRWRWRTWVLWNLAGIRERMLRSRPVRTCPHLIAGRCQACVDTWPS